MAGSIFLKSTDRTLRLSDRFLFEYRDADPGRTPAREYREPAVFFGGIEITKACNLRCRHCLALAPDCSPGCSEYSEGEIDGICRSLHAHGLSRICVSGGEPFLASSLYDWLDAFRRYGLDVRINTNSLAITGDDQDRLSGYDCIHEIEVSFNHHADDGFLYGDGANTIPRRIEKISGLIARGFNVICSTVMTDENLDSLREIEIRLADLGVKEWRLREMLVRDLPSSSFTRFGDIERALGKLLSDDRKLFVYGYLYDYLRTKEIRHRCRYLEKDFVFISADGDVSWICGLNVSFGNIRTEPVEDILDRFGSASETMPIPARCELGCRNRYLCFSSPYSRLAE